MNEAEHEPACLREVVRTIAAESGLGEDAIRQHPKSKGSQDAIEFVIELEEELDLP